MDDRVCRFVSNRGVGDSPSYAGVYETLILPAMAHFPGFSTHLYEYDIEPGSISDEFLEDILAADLVVADLTELSPSGYFQLGVRHSSGRPLVFIADQQYVTSLHPIDFRFVRYPFERPAAAGEDERATAALIDAI